MEKGGGKNAAAELAQLKARTLSAGVLQPALASFDRTLNFVKPFRGLRGPFMCDTLLRTDVPFRRHLPVKPQQWKVNDDKAQKSGSCHTVYWIKEKKPQALKITSTTKQDKERWLTGSTYKGEWKDNKKHGYGVQIWPNGNKYEGEWQNNMRHGHGTFWIKEAPTVCMHLFSVTGLSRSCCVHEK
jgi:hypothetical protein